MKSQVLHTLSCSISCEAAWEIWNWSLLGMKGLTLSLDMKSQVLYTIWCTVTFLVSDCRGKFDIDHPWARVKALMNNLGLDSYLQQGPHQWAQVLIHPTSLWHNWVPAIHNRWTAIIITLTQQNHSDYTTSNHFLTFSCSRSSNDLSQDALSYLPS